MVRNGDSKRRVLIVERNPLLANVLRQVLQAYATPTIVSGMEVSRMQWSSEDDPPPVLLLDQGSLSEGARRTICKHCLSLPQWRKIVLDQEFSTEQAFSLLLLGAHGFLCYHEVERDVCDAIDAVSHGRLWAHPLLMENVCSHLQGYWGHRSQGMNGFTPRQKQVMTLVARNLSNKQIASQLQISENTVKFHLAKIFDKTGKRARGSLADLVRSPGSEMGGTDSLEGLRRAA